MLTEVQIVPIKMVKNGKNGKNGKKKMVKNGKKCYLLTAGKAKNDIPRRAQNDAMIFPCHVFGTASPYPTVQSVI